MAKLVSNFEAFGERVCQFLGEASNNLAVSCRKELRNYVGNSKIRDVLEKGVDLFEKLAIVKEDPSFDIGKAFKDICDFFESVPKRVSKFIDGLIELGKEIGKAIKIGVKDISNEGLSTDILKEVGDRIGKAAEKLGKTIERDVLVR